MDKPFTLKEEIFAGRNIHGRNFCDCATLKPRILWNLFWRLAFKNLFCRINQWSECAIFKNYFIEIIKHLIVELKKN